MITVMYVSTNHSDYTFDGVGSGHSEVAQYSGTEIHTSHDHYTPSERSAYAHHSRSSHLAPAFELRESDDF